MSSLVTILQPPDFSNDFFELCTAESLGLIVFCRTCEVVVLLWDSELQCWLDHEDVKCSTYTVRCWCDCGRLVHRPGTHIVRRFRELQDH